MQRVLCSGVLQRIVIKPPCRGKSYGIKSFCPYRAILFLLTLPRVLPWARSFCPLPFPSAGDRWFRARGVNLASSVTQNRQALFTFLPFYLYSFVPTINPFFLTFAPETLKEMKTYEKERNFASTLDRDDDDDAGSMCLFSTGG